MVVVITGSTKGIGSAIVDRFASATTLMFLNARDEVELATQAQKLKQSNPSLKVLTFAADLSDKAKVKAFGSYILSNTDVIDVLVNNVGVYLGGSLIDEPDGQLEQMMNTNTYSAYHLTRQLLPIFLNRRMGHIFNMCSVASMMAYPNGGSYSISKFALLGFSKCLREELKPFGIKVTSVLPGATWSNSWSGSGVSPDRIMEANDIAEMIWAATLLSANAVMEEIILRPQLGDL